MPDPGHDAQHSAIILRVSAARQLCTGFSGTQGREPRHCESSESVRVSRSALDPLGNFRGEPPMTGLGKVN